MGPRVSVVMVAYNHAHFLTSSIPSLLAQTETDWELLVWDDGSTDNTAAYLASLGDARIRHFSGPHSRGNQDILLGLWLNLAGMATAPLLCPLIASAIWHPEKLRTQLAAFAREPAPVLAATVVEVLDADGCPTGEKRCHVPADYDETPVLALLRGNCIAWPSVMMRREDFVELGGIDPTYIFGGEYDLWLKLAVRGRFAFCPEVLTGYRMHATSRSMSPKVQAQFLQFEPPVVLANLTTGIAPCDLAPWPLAGALLTRTAVEAWVPLWRAMALPLVVQALERTPEDGDLRAVHVTLLAGLRRFGAATAQAEAYDSPNATLTAQQQSWHQALQGSLMQAARAQRTNDDLAWPADPIWDSVASTWFGVDAWRAGSRATAYDCWHDAFVARADDPRSHMNLGLAYLADGKPAAARHLWEVAAFLAPDDAGIQLLLGRGSPNVKVYTSRLSPLATALAQAGCHVQIGGRFPAHHVDVVLLNEDVEWGLVTADPRPLFVWSHGDDRLGIPALGHGTAPLQALYEALKAPRRAYLPWGDPPPPLPLALPALPPSRLGLWLSPEAGDGVWRSAVTAYFATFRVNDPVCLVLAADPDEVALAPVMSAMRQLVAERGPEAPAVTLLQRPGLRFESVSWLAAMSAVLATGSPSGIDGLAEARGTPVLSLDPAALRMWLVG